MVSPCPRSDNRGMTKSQPMPFVHRERARFGDIDGLRHVNNVVFLRYFETARIAYLHEIAALDMANPQQSSFTLIFAECHIHYRAPVRFNEEVAIRCGIDDLQRSSFKVPFHMYVDERLVADGYGVLVGFDYAAQRAAPLPEAIRERLAMELAGA